MGRNPRWEDHAELPPGLTVLVVGLYFFDRNAGLSQQNSRIVKNLRGLTGRFSCRPRKFFLLRVLSEVVQILHSSAGW